MDIGEVSRTTGVAPSALRYYEQRGLIEPVGRTGLRRQYDDAVVERLRLIALWRRSGFSLDEITGMFGADGEPRIERAALTAKADELDERIRELTALRDGLRHAADCPAPSHLECPTFRRALADATFPAQLS
ncbi:helix-turn-helix domain-containing protein [Solirubrobacter phytolaccae]|uniref:Helix-turn-helix domain-containing protein n=1 Tax=Solirubrobacter phytolaccae TaxID=1404360 RepID=A0A9X3SD60_9ACTN|nr:helix-turn-helix domain-containing protein [Solirubrobacter phytolaccae]MDA0183305.1 helix-turn-helix domain-containing protein [Solirubrobacter phytolaccae]